MRKKLYEDLSSIKNEVQTIRKYVEPQNKIDDGIEIKTFFPNPSIQPTMISFQMNYPYWLKLEKSKEWKAFRNLLMRSQRKSNQQIRQELLN